MYDACPHCNLPANPIVVHGPPPSFCTGRCARENETAQYIDSLETKVARFRAALEFIQSGAYDPPKAAKEALDE